jgi:hypothetical protein
MNLDKAKLLENHPRVQRVYENKVVRTTVALIAIGGLALGSLELVKGRGSDNTSKSEINTRAAANDCVDFQSSNSSSNPNTYFSTSFLPKPETAVNSDISAQNYVNQLFGKTGPLAGKNGDINSLAAIMATVVVPAQEGAISNPKYSYVDTFNQEVARYSVAGGEGTKAAALDCKTTFDTVLQVEGYNTDWVQAGADVTEFEAQRNSNNTIDGMKLVQMHADQNMQGIEFKLNQDVKGLKGFTEILVSTNPTTAGEIFAEGTIVQPSTSNNKQKNQGSSGSNNKNTTNKNTTNKNTTTTTSESSNPNNNKNTTTTTVHSGSGETTTTIVKKGPGGTTTTTIGRGPGGTTTTTTTPEGTTTTTTPEGTTTTTVPRPTTTTTTPEGTTTTTTPEGTTTTTVPRPTTTTTVPRPTTTTTVPHPTTTTTTPPTTTTTVPPTTTTTQPKGTPGPVPCSQYNPVPGCIN